MSARTAATAAFLGLILYGLLLASILLIINGLVSLETDSSLSMSSLVIGIALLIIVLMVYSQLYQGWKKSVWR